MRQKVIVLIVAFVVGAGIALLFMSAFREQLWRMITQQSDDASTMIIR